MNPRDAELEELGPGLRGLSKRSLVGFFWACSIALLPEFQAWAAAHVGVRTEPLLRDALAAAYRFSVEGIEIPAPGALLDAVVESAPPGDYRDDMPSTVAQDCWICADACIRVLVDDSFDACGATSIYYALEPVLQAATEDLYGFSELGSSPEEEAQERLVLKHPSVAAALDFVRWASGFLQERPAPTDADLALVRSRASVLAPR